MAVSETAIWKAIKTHFDGATGPGTVYAAVGGRYYFSRTIDNPTFPYLVVFPVSHVTNWTFGATAFEQPVVQFSVFADDPDECLDIKDKLRARFDLAGIAFSGAEYKMVSCRPVSETGPTEEEESGEREVWMATVDYMIEAQKL